jgi:predicted negative regulator of RcsB-dependent stress response
VASKAKHPEPVDTIAEIESRGERAMEWVGQNAKTVISAALICLLVAGAFGYFDNARKRRENTASDALAKAHDGYRFAMGASPGTSELPELANPAVAEQVRQEYTERFGAVAQEHPGTPSAAIAGLEHGNLAAASGDADGALAIWRSAIAGLPGGSPLAGILHQRIGQSLEDSGDWEAAAQAHAAAAAIDSYTFRYWAMADAARCYLLADRPEKALELSARLESEAPDLQLPDYLRARLRELRMANPS